MAAISYRVSYSFGVLPDTQLDDFGANVVVVMTGNAAFPAPPFTMAELGALRLTFHSAVLAASQGGSQLIALREEAHDALVLELRQVGAYVQSVAGQTLSVLLSSGFETVSTNRTQSPLDTPVILAIDNSMSTQFTLRLQPVANARTYQFQKCVTGGPWQDAGLSTQARSILVTGLVPGTIYSIQSARENIGRPRVGFHQGHGRLITGGLNTQNAHFASLGRFRVDGKYAMASGLQPCNGFSR